MIGLPQVELDIQNGEVYISFPAGTEVEEIRNALTKIAHVLQYCTVSKDVVYKIGKSLDQALEENDNA